MQFKVGDLAQLSKDYWQESFCLENADRSYRHCDPIAASLINGSIVEIIGYPFQNHQDLAQVYHPSLDGYALYYTADLKLL